MHFDAKSYPSDPDVITSMQWTPEVGIAESASASSSGAKGKANAKDKSKPKTQTATAAAKANASDIQQLLMKTGNSPEAKANVAKTPAKSADAPAVPETQADETESKVVDHAPDTVTAADGDDET